MTRRVASTTAAVAELPEGIHELSGDGERRLFFAEHAELVRLSTVDLLCEEVNRTARVDLGVADRLLATAGWLAAALDDETARGRHLRASANVLLVKRRLAESAEAYREALALFERAGDRREVVRTLSTGLAALTYLGEFDRAMEWVERARDLCAELDEPQLRARLELNVGHALAYQDRLEEALDRFRAAHRHFLDGGRAVDIAVSLRNIAVCLQQLHRFEAAVEAYREARRYCQQHDLPRLVLRIDYNVGYLYFLRGEYSRAMRQFDEVREECDRHDDPHHAALCDLDQAEILLELNLAEEARALARTATDAFHGLGMPYEAAKALTVQAIAAGHGDRRRADRLLERARESFAAQGNRFWVAATDLYRARFLEGRDRPAAARLAETSLEAFRAIGLPTKIALCELFLARLALAEGAAGDAGELAGSALERLRPVGVPALEARALFLTGQVAEAEGRSADALAAYLQAEATFERLRGQLHTEELKIGQSREMSDVYEALVAIHLAGEIGDPEPARAFDVIQRAKSRSLAELLATRLGEIRPTQPAQAKLAHEINELRAEVSWLHRQIEMEESRGSEYSPERTDRLRGEAVERERRLLRRVRRLRTADPELSALQGLATVAVEELRASLPEATALIEYFIAHGIVHGAVLSGAGLSVRPLCEASEVEAAHRDLRHQISKFRLGKDYLAQLGELPLRATTRALGRLHAGLVRPLAELLDCRHLIVAPHGPLHELPFHAFHGGARHLGDEFSISYAPSATVFHRCVTRPGEPGEGALVLGVPDERAPMIEDEARAVAAMLPGCRLLIGEEASPESLARLGARRRLLHVATHGLFRRDNPMFSAIRLGTAQLSLLDIYNLRLRADLVVLSGCGTGLSAVRGADELLGLTRGLLYAGARAVMVTLWDIDDETTCRLMTGFYRHLETAPALEALGRAQRELRQEYPHPYYWAPFVIVGWPGGR